MKSILQKYKSLKKQLEKVRNKKNTRLHFLRIAREDVQTCKLFLHEAYNTYYNSGEPQDQEDINVRLNDLIDAKEEYAHILSELCYLKSEQKNIKSEMSNLINKY